MHVVTLDELAADEARQLDVSTTEDMAAQHKRYRQRGGTQDACRLDCERDMPARSDGAAWVAFQAARTSNLKGGYDPCNLLK